MSLDETCSCGARFVLTDIGSIVNASLQAAAKWREGHVHAAPTMAAEATVRVREGDHTSYPVGFVKEN